MNDRYISLAHGNGGRYMRELIEQVFARHLANPLLNVQTDAASLPPLNGTPVFTTDGYIVQPLEFPGGDIGTLAVHGTVNDLAVSGATPLYISLNAFIEEGLEWEQLDRIIRSLANAAQAAGVQVVAGDTKVLRRGEGGGLYLATSGIGVRPPDLDLGMHKIVDGDCVLVSGPVGDHGVSVMLAREEFGMRGDLQSDCASVLPLTRALLPLGGLRFMRDPTRGGLATVAHEIVHASHLEMQLDESAIPLRDAVRSVCEILGYDPLYLACEGRVVAVVDARAAPAALAAWQALPQGSEAAIIGQLRRSPQARVVLKTAIGGERTLSELEDDPLPRIC